MLIDACVLWCGSNQEDKGGVQLCGVNGSAVAQKLAWNGFLSPAAAETTQAG